MLWNFMIYILIYFVKIMYLLHISRQDICLCPQFYFTCVLRHDNVISLHVYFKTLITSKLAGKALICVHSFASHVLWDIIMLYLYIYILKLWLPAGSKLWFCCIHRLAKSCMLPVTLMLWLSLGYRKRKFSERELFPFTLLCRKDHL